MIATLLIQLCFLDISFVIVFTLCECRYFCSSVHSDLPAPSVSISFSGSSTAGLSHSISCTATVVPGLVALPTMMIVFPNSTVVLVHNTTSVNYTFSPLRTSDGGHYTCTATINITQAGITNLTASKVETINVLSKFLFSWQNVIKFTFLST